MALDIAILGTDGRPEESIQFRLESHVRLMALAEGAGLRLLSRLTTYYEDVDYKPAELEAFLGEVGVALEEAQGDPGLQELLSSLSV